MEKIHAARLFILFIWFFKRCTSSTKLIFFIWTGAFLWMQFLRMHRFIDEFLGKTKKPAKKTQTQII